MLSLDGLWMQFNTACGVVTLLAVWLELRDIDPEHGRKS